MECFYINLDSANTRRVNLENNFLEHKIENWSLTRFPAIDTSYIHAHKVGGNLRPGEKACFFSHKNLIGAHLNNKNPILIMEDDAAFGKHTCKIVDGLLANNNLDWDILYTDFIAPDISTMADLIQWRHQLSPKNDVTILNLSEIPFAGSTSYILNSKSIRKIFDLLDAEDVLDIPYDLYLRNLIYEKKINGFSFFPFITSLSEFSESSQIQQNDMQATDLILSTFRKMIWMDRDLENQKPLLDDIHQKLCDEESKLFGTIFAAIISKNFKLK
jgi:GR25 family glycosyltransferase involved in LPS biosynthesis